MKTCCLTQDFTYIQPMRDYVVRAHRGLPYIENLHTYIYIFLFLATVASPPPSLEWTFFWVWPTVHTQQEYLVYSCLEAF